MHTLQTNSVAQLNNTGLETEDYCLMLQNRDLIMTGQRTYLVCVATLIAIFFYNSLPNLQQDQYILNIRIPRPFILKFGYKLQHIT